MNCPRPHPVGSFIKFKMQNSKCKISLHLEGKVDAEQTDEVFFKETILEFFVRYGPDCPKKS